MPIWVENQNVGYARLEVLKVEEASQHAHAELADEDLDDLEDDDDDPVLTGSDRPSPRKSTQVRAFQAGHADDEEPEASQAPKPKKPKTKAAAEPKQTTLTQPWKVKGTLSLPDPGTAVGSTSRSKMLAAGLNKKEKPSRRWSRCSPVFQDLVSRIARSRIPRLGNSPFLFCIQKRHLEMMIILTPRRLSSSPYCKASHSESLTCPRTQCIATLHSLSACC